MKIIFIMGLLFISISCYKFPSNNDHTQKTKEERLMDGYNIQYNEIINTKAFSNNEILTKYDYDTANKKVSPNGNYTAINDLEYIIIVNESNEIIFKYKWNDEINNFPFSETVYLLDWSEDGSELWFYSWQPSFVVYIAKADVINKKLYLYSFPNDCAFECIIDTTNEIFYYSDYFSNDFDKENKEYNLYKYDTRIQPASATPE